MTHNNRTRRRTLNRKPGRRPPKGYKRPVWQGNTHRQPPRVKP